MTSAATAHLVRQIRLATCRFKLFYFEAALKQIDPLHDDVPYIVGRIQELRTQLETETTGEPS